MKSQVKSLISAKMRFQKHVEKYRNSVEKMNKMAIKYVCIKQ